MGPDYEDILRDKKYSNVHRTDKNKLECPEAVMKNTGTVNPRTNEK